MKIIIISIFISTFLFLFAANVKAVERTVCHPIYGGGIKENCLEMQKKTTQTQIVTAFPVYPPKNLGSSPATGPKTTAIIALTSSLILGLILRKKSVKFI